MNDDLDRTIAEGLRRRADAMPASPLGFGDVQHRIARTRQRTATFAAAAVMVPAVAGLAYLVGHREDRPLASGSPETTILATATTAPSLLSPASYRCQGEVADDGVFTYYQYCEYIDQGVPPMTTTFVTMPPMTTGLASPLERTLLVVDATGGLPIDQVLSSRGLTSYASLPASRTLEQTMIMPIGDDVTLATQLAELVPVGGFDTWDSSLIDGPVPDGVTAVLVLGTDALDYYAPASTTTMPGVFCPPFTTVLPTATTTLDPTTTTSAPPTTTIC